MLCYVKSGADKGSTQCGCIQYGLWSWGGLAGQWRLMDGGAKVQSGARDRRFSDCERRIQSLDQREAGVRRGGRLTQS